MSVKTGIFRIAQVIKWIGVLALAGFLVGALATLVDRSGGLALVIALSGGVVYAICRALAWVLEGFAKD